MKNQLKKSFTKSEKTRLIKGKYNLEPKPVDFNKLPYIKKIYLLAVFRVLTNEEFNKIVPLNSNTTPKILSPTQSMDESILDCLNSSNVILVDPKSNHNSFNFNGEKCVSFKVGEVAWIANICHNNGERLQLFECYRLIYDNLTKFIPTSKHAIDQVYSFTFNLALNEVEDYLLFKTKELGYEFKFGKKTYVFIYQLLDFLSVSEIYSIIDLSIDQDHLYISRYGNEIFSYGNTIGTKLIELGESIKRNELSVEKSSRKKDLQRSELSKIFYELIHQGNDEGFYECPKKYWTNNLEDCYSSESG